MEGSTGFGDAAAVADVDGVAEEVDGVAAEVDGVAVEVDGPASELLFLTSK